MRRQSNRGNSRDRRGRGGGEEGENKQSEGRKQQEDKVIFFFPAPEKGPCSRGFSVLLIQFIPRGLPKKTKAKNQNTAVNDRGSHEEGRSGPELGNRGGVADWCLWRKKTG